MRSSARTECIKSLIKLKRQEDMIEKTLDHFLHNMKLDPEIIKVLKDERCSHVLERKKLANSLRTLASDTGKCLEEIKMSIKDMQEDRKIDVNSFKEKLITLAKKFREFKNDTTMEALTNEEIELDREMNSLSVNLAKIENRTPCQRKKSTGSIDTDSQDYTGAKDFDALIAKTGHTQNWSEPDHLLFLKVRNNCQNVTSIVAAIRKKCPDLTAERIINHEAWYKTYLELREKQRNAIREWRENRETKKRENIVDHLETENCEESKKNPSVCKSPDKRFNSKPMIPKNTTNSEKKNDAGSDKKELLKRWRAEKEKTVSLETEQSRSETESLRKLAENRRLQRARAIKTAVVAYKESKMGNTSSDSTSSVTDFERIASKSKIVKMIKSYRRQDEEFLRRRKAMLESKKIRPSTVGNRKVHDRSKVEESTLLKPTKVWLEKCKATKDPNQEVASRGICYVKDIPKLGTYNWRNHESR